MKLIQRHEAFRTSFEILEGRPVQRVYDEVDFEIVKITAKETEIDHTIEAFIRPFDLGVAPLLRAQLVQTGRQTLLNDRPASSLFGRCDY